MSLESQNNDNQEIDLSQLSKKIGNLFENISTKIFQGILFIKKNIIVIGVLFILGAVLGYLLDKSSKSYDNKIIVAPNFGSNDYLYSKIELINAKIKENDTVFLKETVGIKEPKKFGEITIQPITDVYKFIDNKPENFELIKLMSEDGDIKKVIVDRTTSKNYPYHLIDFKTSKLTTDQNTVQPILNYLNDSEYFLTLQKEYLNNIKLKMVANDSIISQIDGVLNSFSSAINGSQRNEKLIYYNENTQLNDIIKTKNELTIEQGNQRVNFFNFNKIIKDNSSTINIKETNGLNGKMKFIVPILFVLLFIVVTSFNLFYKKQVQKNKI